MVLKTKFSSPLSRSRKLVALALSLGLLFGSTLALITEGAASAAGSPTKVQLASSAAYSVLAGTTSTNAATAAGRTPTLLTANLGVYPGTSLTGFDKVDSGPGIVNGRIDGGNSLAASAQLDASAAYMDAQSRSGTALSASTFQLGGHTYSPGVYSAGSSLDITGTVTLDGGGNPNAVFIFQAGSTLTTAAGSPTDPAGIVRLTNGTQAANVFWQVGSSATLGTYSYFSGTIIALTSITATTGASVNGRLIALNAAVTLDTNNISTSTAPVLTISGGLVAGTVDTTPTISGTSDELGGTVSVTVSDPGGLHTLSGLVDSSGNWSVTPVTPLGEGSHTVTARVVDAAGTLVTKTQALTVDSTPSSVPSTAPLVPSTSRLVPSTSPPATFTPFPVPADAKALHISGRTHSNLVLVDTGVHDDGALVLIGEILLVSGGYALLSARRRLRTLRR
jgi:hypothetical protein